MAVTQSVPRWLQAYTQPTRAPQKAPPPAGALPVERWSIPQELRNHNAWATWRYEYYQDRWSKPPYNPDTGERAEPSDASTWSDFDTCFDSYRAAGIPSGGGRPYDGVSFALDLRWGIVGIDLDHVSEHRRDAAQITRLLDSYTEHTPGRDGLRIFVRGQLPEGRRRRDWVEMYIRRRFLTVTGQHVTGSPKEVRSSRQLNAVWRHWVQQDA